MHVESLAQITQFVYDHGALVSTRFVCPKCNQSTRQETQVYCYLLATKILGKDFPALDMVLTLWHEAPFDLLDLRYHQSG